MELMEVMQKRHSVRKYTEEAIPAETLEKILQAAELAPTGKGLKPCVFRAVTDKDTLKALSEAKAGGAGMIKDAAAAIVVFGDSEKTDTWIEDSSIALTYMHLMATDLGLGSCWVQMRLRKDAEGNDAEDNVRAAMGAPEHYRVIGVLPLGFPAE